MNLNDKYDNRVIDKYYKSIYVKCDCSYHMLQVERYYEDKNDKGFNFAIWEHGRGNILSFREKIRWCWNILKTGNPWADSIMVSDETTVEICKFIQSELIKNEK